MVFADLHLHSSASDGSLPPKEVIRMAQTKDLQLVALTDHDTTQGIGEALAAGREFSVQVIPGIELSTEAEYQEVHILGYYIDYNDSHLQEILTELKKARRKRIKEIIRLLQVQGFTLDWEEVRIEAGEVSSIGRPHVARVMVAKGYANSISQAFALWLNPGMPAFVERYKLDPAEAVDIIHSAGGLAFLAHPGLLAGGMERVNELLSAGIDGIEVFHSQHSQAQIDQSLALAQERNLHICGGSDCHGQPLKMGQVQVDTALLKSWLKD